MLYSVVSFPMQALGVLIRINKHSVLTTRISMQYLDRTTLSTYLNDQFPDELIVLRLIPVAHQNDLYKRYVGTDPIVVTYSTSKK